MEKEDEIVIFSKYDDPAEAYIVKGLLETNGIVAGVMEDNISHGLMMAPVTVMVMRRDLEKARQVLTSPAEQ